jgi:hypothetical protein
MLFIFGVGFYSFALYQGELYELIEEKFGVSIYTNLALSLFTSGSFFLWDKLYPSENPEYTYAILLLQGFFSFLASYWRKKTNFDYKPTGKEPGWFFVIAFAFGAGLIQYLERLGYLPGGSPLITYFILCFYGFAAFMAYVQLIVAASRLKGKTAVS